MNKQKSTKERERIVVTSLVLLMLTVWFGFLLHRSPRFAGSFWGGVLGVSGTLMMLFPLFYMVIKRIKWIKARVTKHVSIRTLLAWHIYAGIIGPILVLLHTGHKFESPLGTTIISLMIVVVLSGFIGRYLMSQFAREIREKKVMLTELQGAYSQAQTELTQRPDLARLVRPFSGVFSRVFASLFLKDDMANQASEKSPVMLLRISESIADVEYAINAHEKFKRWFSKWLKLHIVISFALYVLMVLHIWASIHFGLRWFDSWIPTTLKSENLKISIPLDASDEFSRSFSRLYQRYWRPAVTINGFRTTVFDYAGLAEEIKDPGSDYSKALAALRQVDTYGFDNDDREKAFWINIYNFTAMKLAAENYPVNSITDSKISAEKDPWGLKAVEFGGKGYSLRQIEKEILLKKFDDPRIIFAVSCAAVSCPDRTPSIFKAENLDKQLDDMIRSLFANQTKGLVVNKKERKIFLSWILKADKYLFDGTKNPTVIDFVISYAPDKYVEWLKTNYDHLKIEYFKHDWTLNDIAQADKMD